MFVLEINLINLHYSPSISNITCTGRETRAVHTIAGVSSLTCSLLAVQYDLAGLIKHMLNLLNILEILYFNFITLLSNDFKINDVWT